ncbi:MAG: RNA 3'-terminal phosphate cyclase [Candidatus Riflebacteria bacterium]|nr:RNA 3'-terminal phosphate cyclase [Candidatus Riflebacteria bacterium]
MIQIDGSEGEGGGQILRSALALSACTGKPFRISNIRAGRKKTGLLRQHLTAVLAIQKICDAEVIGAEISSQVLEFHPGIVKPGKYSFAVGTAGSSILVLQTILPPLLTAGGISEIEIEGGTHNPASPPFHYMSEVFFPAISLMGSSCKAELLQWGFYPAGGGKFTAKIVSPENKLIPLDLVERGKLKHAEVIAVVSKIPWEIADEECRLIVKSARFQIDKIRPETVKSPGPGNAAMILMEFENSRAMFTAFGEQGVSRNRVAHLAASAANKMYESGAATDEHLADQMLLPMALAGSGSFTTTSISDHTITNISTIKKFLDIRIEYSQTDKKIHRVQVGD